MGGMSYIRDTKITMQRVISSGNGRLILFTRAQILTLPVSHAIIQTKSCEEATMQFISGKIGGKIKIEAKLRNCTKAFIATAYFCPRESTWEALKEIRNLSLMYRNRDKDYVITDPDKLMELADSSYAEVRYVPDLHAKVYYGVRKKGSCFAFIGSANLTNDGLFSNHEAGILLDSRNPGDLGKIKEISEWLQALWSENINNKFDTAEHDRAVAARVRETRAKVEIHPWKGNTETNFKKDWTKINYWMLKTTEGKNGVSHWREFLNERVIAIGFADSACEGHCMVRYFKDFKEGDIVLICRGYSKQMYVRLYGVARVTGPYRNRKPHSIIEHEDNGRLYQQWHRRRKADVMAFPDNFKIPVETLKACLKSDKDRKTGSRTQTIHPIRDHRSFEKLSNELSKYDITIDI